MGKDVQEEKDDNKGSKYNTLCDDGAGSILDTYVHTFGIMIIIKDMIEAAAKLRLCFVSGFLF